MAIQLNDRDHLIFKLVDEHQVLLEKHISWFISGDDKPVLIRDRLRKLFYLDYLLCHRHATKLPWWTTPTKPLVYMLAPLARTTSGLKEEPTVDLFDSDVQRHLLEVANLRMMHLIGVKECEIADFTWTTCKTTDATAKHLDATVSFKVGGKTHNVGILNHPEAPETVAANVEKATKNGCDAVFIVSRDDAHQAELQTLIAKTSVAGKCFFATHHELYKNGIVKTAWQAADQSTAQIFTSGVVDATVFTPAPSFTPIAI
ncbi:MAG TPA: hypothetical protein V6C76_08910 [Drouetiella sp.]